MYWTLIGYFTAGVLIGSLSIGWFQEVRIGAAKEATTTRALQSLTLDFLTVGEALRLAVPDAKRRAELGAAAAGDVVSGLKPRKK